MAGQLQELLAKIQQDGVAKADAKAKEIIAAAEKRAAAIAAEAEAKAKEITRAAEQNAATLIERGTKSLEQAARDVVLSVGEAVQALFERLARERTREALSAEALRPIVAKAVEGALARGETRLEVLLAPADQQKVGELLLADFRKAAGKTVELKADGGVIAGFRLSIGGGGIEHDFSAEAIGAALAQLVRPELAQIVRQAMTR